ncbi:hypothetical protein C7U92_22800 [Bradyrhizobium sp. WBOS7]|uniref:Uncharacterized protein n=1 Tax=Bradyrhizobium betae TaxID=244734 RepID=A0AAE9SXF7_9BRAD|nr:hypothetical protein [Bradyrhizobium sp. WBOS2]MDD1573393.1 hypothetical protein [Bradyrhizobium sp. WBOS1]MDD1579528.1 hypothetical protein [Bradyrhizobium sp. WBOS7]MDD1603071.1 hypothetical protein [Bradyrhizobium sp. WBOS16]UUO38384.1 hypothetical protein DCK84_29900 [Bradyrhizobium sp. WBOS01]UUO44551.1 hypothetical protein DCM75_29875 [Bradyrhizobium sp. WBOS02]UUO54958.1 hypothetical protein DCM79_19470 [Bradyrhizobium sp. WBOS07]UUO69016.1 hypothetical protein DCM83_29915 [Bradyrh
MAGKNVGRAESAAQLPQFAADDMKRRGKMPAVSAGIEGRRLRTACQTPLASAETSNSQIR